MASMSFTTTHTCGFGHSSPKTTHFCSKMGIGKTENLLPRSPVVCGTCPAHLLGLPEDLPKVSEGFLRVWSVTIAKPVKLMDTRRTGIPSPPVPGCVGFPAIGVGRGNLDRPKHPDSGNHVSGSLFAVKNDIRRPVVCRTWPRHGHFQTLVR